ncbi:MAG TPA: pyridoxal phosphate-dependent aminotransferase family protein [Crocinitomix sp.]|nr:pyridoxal phosphate-dependent aminotransferase family protein [Crocinitomix sp.]
MNFPKKLADKLEKRIADNAFRNLINFSSKHKKTNKNWVDFFSNDYLGLSRVEFKGKYANGSTGSRLISGNLQYTTQLEQLLANFFNTKSGLIFNSGYDANLGIFSSIPQRGDTVIYDELCHASIRDGIRLSFAKNFSFKHNNTQHLQKRLEQAKGNIYVVIESIYSMDGDEALLGDISTLCERFGAFLVVDEAHSGGLYGKNGSGLVSKYGLDDKVFIKLITFGKAFGSHGAVVLCDEKVRDFLINFAKSFIYTTALPLHSLKRIEQVIDLCPLMNNVRHNLFDLVAYFKQEAILKNVELIESNSPIQSILISGNARVKKIESDLQNAGFAVKAILSPTVPKGKERIRICLHAHNMKNQVSDFFKVLNLKNE